MNKSTIDNLGRAMKPEAPTSKRSESGGSSLPGVCHR